MSGTQHESPDHSLPHTVQEHSAHQDDWSPAVLAKIIAEALVYAAENSHDCVYDIIGVEYPNSPRPNQPVHPRIMLGRPEVTRVLVKCLICHAPSVVALEGHWDAGEIMGTEHRPERM